MIPTSARAWLQRVWCSPLPLNLRGLREPLYRLNPTLGILEMYTQKDVWTSIADNTKFATCKQKWEEIKCIYRGVGSMSSFNTWVALTSTTLGNSSSMLAQFQKLNDAHLTLENNDMKVSDLQFCFIFIKALLESYSAVMSTILATGEPKDLSPQKIQNRILNEEGRQS